MDKISNFYYPTSLNSNYYEKFKSVIENGTNESTEFTETSEPVISSKKKSRKVSKKNSKKSSKKGSRKGKKENDSIAGIKDNMRKLNKLQKKQNAYINKLIKKLQDNNISIWNYNYPISLHTNYIEQFHSVSDNYALLTSNNTMKNY